MMKKLIAGCKNCDLLFLLRHPQCHPHSKNQGQIRKYDIAGIAHHLEYHIEECSFTQKPLQSIGSDHIGIAE